jgi:dienelactone hydrolase
LHFAHYTTVVTKQKTLRYTAGDVQAKGFLAIPSRASGPFRGVLVVPEGPGLGEHARQRAMMLAELGYVALAADLYGDGHIAQTHEEVLQRVGELRARRDVLRRRVCGGLDALAALEYVDVHQLAAIGYCFGGMAVLELARSGAAVARVASFHGLLDTPRPENARKIRADVLVFTGAQDNLVTDRDISAFEREMTAANVNWQLIKYGGAKHAFTNRIDAVKLQQLGFDYNEQADRRSWALLQLFLGE